MKPKHEVTEEQKTEITQTVLELADQIGGEAALKLLKTLVESNKPRAHRSFIQQQQQRPQQELYSLQPSGRY